MNQEYNPKKHSIPNSTLENSANELKVMCNVVKKDICHIDFTAPAYLKEQGTLRKKEEQREATLVDSKGKETHTDINLNSSNPAQKNNTVLIPRFQGTIQNKPLETNPEQLLKVLSHSDNEENTNANNTLPTLLNFASYFLKEVSVRILNSTYYVYNGRCYVAYRNDDMRSLIMDKLRCKIEDNGPSFINNIAEFVKLEPTIQIKDSDIRTDIVAFENGILNIKTGQFLPHHPSYIVTHSILGNYLPNTPIETPYFDQYLRTLTGNDPLLIERIYQMIGYVLTPDTNGKCVFLLQGIQSSGKSVMTRLLEKMLSQGAYYPIQSDKLKGQFALSELFGRALCICQDMPNEPLDMKAVSVIKCISGNDTISSDVKFKNAITFHCKAKIILTTNFAVVCKSKDEAFYSRLVTIGCKYTVPKHEQNPNLLNLLLSETDGIISKAMAAYFRLVQNGYNFAGDYLPNTAINFNDNYSEDVEMNILNFAKSMFEPDPNGKVFTDDAHELYQNQNIAIARNKFSEIFKRICEENLGATRGKRYKEFIDINGDKQKSANALHCMLGIRFKSNIL